MTQRLPITRLTKVTVYSGVSAKGLPPFDPGGGGGTPNTFALAVTSLAVTEGLAPKKVQAYSLLPAPETELIAFQVHHEGIPEGQRAVRGVNFELVDANGDLLEGDYFAIRVNQQRADVYVRALDDSMELGELRFFLRLVADNTDVATTGQLQSPIECLVSILDAETIRMGLGGNSFTVTEPDTGESVTVSIPVNLSGPALVDVEASVNITSTTAVLGQDYSVISGSVFIPAGELEDTIELSIIGNDIFNDARGILVEIHSPTGGVELLPAATQAVVRINDNDAATTYPVGFASSHNGTVTVIEGGEEVAVRVVLEDGVASSEQILVDWTLEEVGGSGVVIGQDITTSSTNPLVIPAGSPFAEIKLNAPANASNTENRAFRLTIDGVTGGGAELGSNLELAGTLQDTTTPKPVARWSQGNLTMTEGSTAQKGILLDIPAPNPLTIEIEVTGTATDADVSIESVEFATGETFKNAVIEAVLDGITEPQEVATLTLKPTADYDVTTGTAKSITVTISDPAPGSTILKYKPMPPGYDTLVSVVTGFDPTSRTSPPKVVIDGLRADVFPVDPGRSRGLVHAWEAVVLTGSTSGQSIMTIGNGSEPLGPGYMTDSLDDLEFELQTWCKNRVTQFPPHKVKLGDGITVEVTKDGHYLREETILLRPRLASEAGTKHEYCMQILCFVKRTPHGVTMLVEVCNEAYENLGTRGHFDFADDRHELDGTVHFDYLRINDAAGWKSVFDEHPRCSDGNFLIAQGAKKHRFPPQRRWALDVAFIPATNDTTLADAMLRTEGEATARSGAYAFNKRPWYGAKRAFLPEWGASYRYGSLTGMDASEARGANYRSRAELAVRGVQAVDLDHWPIRGQSSSGTNLGGGARSWFEPARAANSYVGGGQMIFLRMGFDHNPDCWRGMRLHARMLIQADPSGEMDPNTGHQHGIESLAATNTFPPGQLNTYPFVWHSLNDLEAARNIWFVPLSRRPVPNASYDQYCRRPVDRDWNPPPDDGIEEDFRVEPIGNPVLNPDDRAGTTGTAKYSWSACDRDHFTRVNEIFHALAWSRNDSWAKYTLKRQDALARRYAPHVLVRGHHAFTGGVLNSIMISAVLPEVPGVLGHPAAFVGGQSGNNQAGIALITQSRSANRTRGHAHMMAAVTAAHCIDDPSSTQYNERRNWWPSWAQSWTSIANSFGYGDRAARISRDGVSGTLFAQILPLTDSSSGIDPGYAWDNPIPPGSSGSEGWQTSYGGARFLDAHETFNSESQYPLIEKFTEALPLAMLRVPPLGGRTPSRGNANQFMIVSTGTQGQRDPLLSAPHEVVLVPGPGNTQNSGIADFRWVHLWTSALMAADRAGRTDVHDELLGYVKLHFGLTEAASLDALEAAVTATTAFDSDNITARFHASAVSDLVGYIQHKNQ